MTDVVLTSPRPTLLIADNDLSARVTLGEELSHRFEIVAYAEDADQAIALARVHRPDIALIDTHMPAGGGIRATREIAQSCPGTAICALSSDELEQEVLDILLAGAEAYTDKGCEREELERILFGCMRARAVVPRFAVATQR
jgi:DNA-binding NarL/FixJ family response regulator